jgi:GNAT superfamily N-acetyltransferase
MRPTNPVAGQQMPVTIQEFSDRYSFSVRDLVHGILTEEFDFAPAAAEQPDLLDVGSHYSGGASKFWVATDDDRLVGTVGLVDLGQGDCLLRKMFVRSAYRGTGVAQLLLNRFVSWATSHGLSTIYLGTNTKFRAAHRFYEKNGFLEVSPDVFPASVPRLDLRDRFFFRSLDERD